MFLLMNKNIVLVLFWYVLSFILMSMTESWALKWAVLELNTLSFVALLGVMNSGKKSESSISYFLLQSMSSFVILMSLLCVFMTKELANPTILFPLALLFKMGVAPLHLWMIPISLMCVPKMFLLLNTWQKILPLVLLESQSPEINSMFLLACLLSIILGSSLNFSSSSLKKLMIFSGISSMAWLLLSITQESYLWKFFFLTYTANFYFMMKISYFKTHPKSFLIFVIFLSFGGLPPLMGFFPKMMIILQSTENQLIWLIIMMLVFSIFDLFIYSRFSMSSLLKPSQQPFWAMRHKLSNKMTHSKFLFMNLMMGFFLFF